MAPAPASVEDKEDEEEGRLSGKGRWSAWLRWRAIRKCHMLRCWAELHSKTKEPSAAEEKHRASAGRTVRSASAFAFAWTLGWKVGIAWHSSELSTREATLSSLPQPALPALSDSHASCTQPPWFPGSELRMRR